MNLVDRICSELDEKIPYDLLIVVRLRLELNSQEVLKEIWKDRKEWLELVARSEAEGRYDFPVRPAMPGCSRRKA